MTGPQGLLKGEGAAARPGLFVALAAAVASGLAAIAVAGLTAHAIDAAVFAGARLADLAPTIAGLFALFVLRAALAWGADVAGFEVAARARRALFERLLDHVGRLGPVRLAGTATGELVTTLTDAVAASEPYWRRYLPAMATTSVLPVAILAVAAPLDWKAALVFLTTLPLLPLFMVLVGRSAERANQRQWASLARLGGHLLDAIQGLADLVLMGAARREIAVVRKMADDYRREAMKVLRLAFLSALVMEFFATVAIAVTAVLVGFRLLWGSISFFDGLYILLLAPQFYAPLRALGSERHAKMEAIAAAERMVALLEKPAPAATGSRRLAPGGALALAFEGVTVRYEGDRLALDRLDLTIAAGEHVAIVGASGAGKSTLFSALLGFVTPSAGRILVDGVPLAELDRDDWLAHVALVEQRARLFDDTIAGNVAMGRDGDVGAALHLARAGGFVGRLPDGAATRLGERGQGISGGEAQRLMIARALLRPAPLVLLDEPTAHLDRDTEAEVGAALAALGAGRTVITIAHRLATVRAADRILVMEAGRIVEAGRHDELVGAGGPYARLVDILETEG